MNFDKNLFSLPPLDSFPEIAALKRASDVGKKLVKHIIDYEKSIPSNMQAGGRFVSSSDGFVFSIERVGCWNPDILIFDGFTSNGSAVQLIQHISQLNILLVAVPRMDDTSKPRRQIGFTVYSD